MGNELCKVVGQSISAAFGIGKGDLVAIVGGGGKTTLMYSLVEELSQNASRVAATTTTKIFAPGPHDPVRLLCGEEPKSLLAAIKSSEGKPPILAKQLLPNNKVKGLPPAHCDALFASGVFDQLIVEADGSRHKPLKAPADWEPVVPKLSTLFIAVIGLSCLGKPLDGQVAFRPELVGKATGLKEGDIITTQALISLLDNPFGLRKGCPPGTRMAVLLNQADTTSQKSAAQDIALGLLDSQTPWDRVVIGHLTDEEPIEESWIK